VLWASQVLRGVPERIKLGQRFRETSTGGQSLGWDVPGLLAVLFKPTQDRLGRLLQLWSGRASAIGPEGQDTRVSSPNSLRRREWSPQGSGAPSRGGKNNGRVSLSFQATREVSLGRVVLRRLRWETASQNRRFGIRGAGPFWWAARVQTGKSPPALMVGGSVLGGGTEERIRSSLGRTTTETGWKAVADLHNGTERYSSNEMFTTRCR